MFTIPGPLTDRTPFAEMHVWGWAKSQPRANIELTKYLDSLGFVVGRDRLTEAQYQTLEYAIDTFHRVYPHFAKPLSFSEALTESAAGFYVQGKPGRYSLEPKLHETLDAAGWIYEVSPETTYFEIINGILWAKYQQIIGSRPLCFVLE